MWAVKQRVKIMLYILFFLGFIFGGVYVISRALDKPLCTDNKQNGAETGIDCGGICSRVCNSDTKPLFISWARVVPVTDTVYSLALEVENKNYDAVAYHAEYICYLKTEDFRTVQTIKETISVPPAGKYQFVVPSMRFASLDVRPVRAECSIRNNHEWFRLPEKITPSPFDFQSIKLSSDERPDASATIINTDRYRVYSQFKVSAVVYDATQTVIAASETLVNRLEPGAKANIVFTWPVQFNGVEPYRLELSPVFDFPDFKTSP